MARNSTSSRDVSFDWIARRNSSAEAIELFGLLEPSSQSGNLRPVASAARIRGEWNASGTTAVRHASVRISMAL